MGKRNGVAGIVPEELKEENYEYWKVCLESYLKGEGLWDIITGEFTEPPENKTSKYMEWEKKNASALHAIQLACGPRVYSKYKRETHISAKYAWEHLAEKKKIPHEQPGLQDHVDEQHPDADTGKNNYMLYENLHKAVSIGDWKAINDFFEKDPSAIRADISSHGDMPLHIAILAGRTMIAYELIKLSKNDDLERTNEFGATPLSLAAINGETKLAKSLVEKNNKLVIIKNEHDEGQLPVIVAAEYGRKKMVHYLYENTPKEELNPNKGTNGATLLNCLITAEFYDVASMLLKLYPHLGVMADHHGHYTLRTLSHKPSAFPSGSQHVFWKEWIYQCVKVHSPWDADQDSQNQTRQGLINEGSNEIQRDQSSIDIHETNDEDKLKNPLKGLLHRLGWILLRFVVPDMKHIHDRKLRNDEAVKLLRCIFVEMSKMSKEQLEIIEIDKAIHDAIKHGIVEFIEEILIYIPEFIWRKDKKGRTIFSHAIVYRQENIFNLIYELGTKRSILSRRHDVFGNNFLHLAAKLSPPSQLERVSGAALQMQRELQWYKEVESLVQPKHKEEVNENNRKPSTLFTDEHKELAAEGEKWLKNTAGSSMIVGTLIAAVMFTTAFTVPGGYDDDTKNPTAGLPIMLQTDKKAFVVFMVANGMSMFTSSTSVLMFLGILTARYAEMDFLKSLPTKLICGLACLFFSIVTMMISFGSALYLTMHKSMSWVTIPIIVFSTFPVVLFSVLQFPLLVEMIYRTYGPGVFKKKNKHQPSAMCSIPKGHHSN